MKTNTTISYNICCKMNCVIFRKTWFCSVQIKTLHMHFMLVQLLAQAQDAELLQLFLLLLPRFVMLRGWLQLLPPPQLRLQSTLQSMPAAVWQLLFQRLRRLPVLLPPLRLLLRFPMCRMLRWLPRRPGTVPELPPTFLLQVPVVVLRGGAFLLRRSCLGGGAVPRVLLRLRMLLPPVQGRMPVPAVRV
jgi:hypothetical protein